MSSFVNLLDIIYPVGSIYISKNEVSPASTVGGTWTQQVNSATVLDKINAEESYVTQYTITGLRAMLLGDWCCVKLQKELTTPSSWGAVTLTTLPEAMKPLTTVSAPCIVQDNGTGTLRLEITNEGVVSLKGSGNSGGYNVYKPVYSIVCYPVASPTTENKLYIWRRTA